MCPCGEAEAGPSASRLLVSGRGCEGRGCGSCRSPRRLIFRRSRTKTFQRRCLQVFFAVSRGDLLASVASRSHSVRG